MRKQCLMFMLLLAASTADYCSTSWTANQTSLTQELSLAEKTMPHVYVIVSRIWARWKKSIGNKIFQKILSSRSKLLFGPSPCRTSVICRITTYFYLTRSFAFSVSTLLILIQWMNAYQWMVVYPTAVYRCFVCTTKVNSAFGARWLASLEVIRQIYSLQASSGARNA